jgi:hypothetical protein
MNFLTSYSVILHLDFAAAEYTDFAYLTLIYKFITG